MFTLIPVTKTYVDEVALQSIYYSATGENIGKKSRDRPGADPLLKSLSTVAEFANIDSDFTSNGGLLLRHAFFTGVSVLDLDTIFEITQASNLSVLKHSTKSIGLFVCLLSGTLEDWRTAILNGCSVTSTSNYTKFCSEAYKVLKNNGLGSLWSDHTYKANNDGTIVLKR